MMDAEEDATKLYDLLWELAGSYVVRDWVRFSCIVPMKPTEVRNVIVWLIVTSLHYLTNRAITGY